MLYLLPEEGLSFKAETSQNKIGAGVSENFPKKKKKKMNNMNSALVGLIHVSDSDHMPAVQTVPQ